MSLPPSPSFSSSSHGSLCVCLSIPTCVLTCTYISMCLFHVPVFGGYTFTFVNVIFKNIKQDSRSLRIQSNKGSAHFLCITDSVDVEDCASSAQKSSLSSQKTVNPLPVPEKYRKRRMPGGRFQVPSDRECLSFLERADGPSSLEDSLSRQDGLEGQSQVALSHSEALEAEERTSHGTSDPRVVSSCSRGVSSWRPALFPLSVF